MFRMLCAKADVPQYQLYGIRHMRITTDVLKGIPYHVIALQCGTSVQMIEKTYAHLLVDNYAHLLG
jgi:hypothetical protein